MRSGLLLRLNKHAGDVQYRLLLSRRTNITSPVPSRLLLLFTSLHFNVHIRAVLPSGVHLVYLMLFWQLLFHAEHADRLYGRPILSNRLYLQPTVSAWLLLRHA